MLDGGPWPAHSAFVLKGRSGGPGRGQFVWIPRMAMEELKAQREEGRSLWQDPLKMQIENYIEDHGDCEQSESYERHKIHFIADGFQVFH